MPDVATPDSLELELAEDLVQTADRLAAAVQDYRQQKCAPTWLEATMQAAVADLRSLVHGRVLEWCGPGELKLRLGGLWRSADLPPATLPDGEHFPVAVLGVVDDETLRVHGEEPFVDVVAWWPALRRWTITHCTRADAGVVEDYPVTVVAWRPMPPIPPKGTVWR